MTRLRPARRVERDGCRACGVCCEVYAGTLTASPADLERWRAEGRADLLALVGEGGAIWVDPATGQRPERCPFLRRTGPEAALCGIHSTKPELCRAYPTAAHRHRCVRGRAVGAGQ